MTRLLHLQAGDVESFGRRPFALFHELTGHPLLGLEALAELADSLPPERVEHNSGRVDAIVPGGSVPRVDLSPGEIVRSIERNDCWIVLPLHGVLAYRELFEALFDEYRPYVPVCEGEIVRRQAVLFLATGGSTTPAHIDLEHGLLLHLRGRKELQVGAFSDVATAQRKIEAMHRGEHRNLAAAPRDPRRFALAPGDGVHIPAFMPHLVRTVAGEVSLSLTIAMKTETTMRQSAVYRANGHLRRFGLRPRAPGVSARVDVLKHRLVQVAAVARTRRSP